jgi:hypothetical protein
MRPLSTLALVPCITVATLYTPAWGQGIPPGCQGACSGASMAVRVNDLPTPANTTVREGDDISYILRLDTLNGLCCCNVGGDLVLTLPNGEVITDSPDVWCHGAGAIEISYGVYTASEEDTNEFGNLVAHLIYTGWTVLSDPPMLDTQKLIEFTYTLPFFANLPCCDANGDGFVDVQDLLEVIMHWGEEGVEADVDGSGVVDVLDLKCIIISWGPCP